MRALFEIIWKSKCEAFTTGLENKLCTLVHRFLPNHTLSADIFLFHVSKSPVSTIGTASVLGDTHVKLLEFLRIRTKL